MESDRTLSTLGNEYNPDIPHAANEPHSTQELNEMLDIPTTTCYHRVEELTAAGFFELHDWVLSDGHRRTDVYHHGIGEIVIRSEGGDCTISVTECPEVKNKLDGMWRKII